MRDSIKLFTYGSLKDQPGCMKNAIHLGKAKTKSKYKKGESWFCSYLEENPGEDHQEGDLWSIEKEDLIFIDEYEGVPDIFYRKFIEVEINSINVLAWCYFLKR